MTHPMIPTQEQFAEWDAEYFDGERQNFDFMMLTAFQAGADRQLEQVEKSVERKLKDWRESGYADANRLSGYTADTIESFFEDIMQAMRPQQQEES